MPTVLDSIVDASRRGWRLRFEGGNKERLTIAARKKHDGKYYESELVIAPGASVDDPYVVDNIRAATDDRRLPLTQSQQLAHVIAERKRRDSGAPDMIAGPLEILDREYSI